MDPSAAGAESPSIEDVCDALADADCREIVAVLDEPMSARELQERCSLPETTLYRKLDRLVEASLLRTDFRFGDAGPVEVYRVDFQSVRVDRTDGDLEVGVTRDRRPDQRLAGLWDAIRREL